MKGMVNDMNKITKFMNDNKLEMQVVAYGIGMFVSGIYLGKKIENIKWNETFDIMARTGATMNNVIDGKEFVCSVTKK